MRKRQRAIRPRAERLDQRCLLSGFDAALVRHAYGLDAVHFTLPSGGSVAADGSGETIALVEAYDDPHLASDLHVFDQANGLPDPVLTVVDQAGSNSDAVWASEEALDVEWAHAIAPGAGIVVVEARSDDMGDLMSAVDLARGMQGVASVSMSWGFSETAAETGFDAHFQAPAGHQGITFVAASGDNGTAGGPQYPAASPRVLAVGGTTLSVGAQGNYLGEVPWSSSGGGPSRYEPEPGYQATLQSVGHRTTPDVAFLGDPDTGVEVYETPTQGGPGAWTTAGGTSLATPAWAAIIAIVDQGRALTGRASLDGATQTLPALYSLPRTDFHAIGPAPGAAASGAGLGLFGTPWHVWPFVRRSSRGARLPSRGLARKVNIQTGLGSPVCTRLIPDLVASDLTRPLVVPAGHAGPRPHLYSASGATTAPA